MKQDDYKNSPLPFVNARNIAKYIGQYAIVHGKCNWVKENVISLQVNEEAHNEILVNNCKKNPPQNTYVKIIGKIAGDNSIEFLDMLELQNDFDLSIVNDFIECVENNIVSSYFA